MTIPEAKYRFVEPDEESGKKALRFNTHVKLDYEDLTKFCWKQLSEIEVDLLMLAGSVALVDRKTKRRRGTGWARKLEIQIPVHDPRKWGSVAPKLVETLEWLTGDIWLFRFRQRQKKDQRALQLYLPNGSASPDVVLSYSGGLDSFAHACTLTQSKLDALLVTTWHPGLGGADPGAFGRAYVRVPLRIKPGKNPEPSYRTRSFVYFIAAALAAKLRGSMKVVVSEPGQGALGPSLVPFGNEHPYRGTHPGFTRRLGALLTAVWGRGAPKFDHPNVWITKAELVSKGIGSGHEQAWRKTQSCSRNIGRAQGIQGLHVRQCGVCSNCLSRRLAVSASKLGDEVYVWNDLSLPSLYTTIDSIEEQKVDREVATYAVLDAEYLARTELTAGASLELAVDEIADGLGISTRVAAGNLKRLLEKHRDEWDSFLKKLPSTSWVRAVAER